jgi:hypothetical protein
MSLIGVDEYARGRYDATMAVIVFVVWSVSRLLIRRRFPIV